MSPITRRSSSDSSSVNLLPLLLGLAGLSPVRSTTKGGTAAAPPLESWSGSRETDLRFRPARTEPDEEAMREIEGPGKRLRGEWEPGQEKLLGVGRLSSVELSRLQGL